MSRHETEDLGGRTFSYNDKETDGLILSPPNKAQERWFFSACRQNFLKLCAGCRKLGLRCKGRVVHVPFKLLICFFFPKFATTNGPPNPPHGINQFVACLVSTPDLEPPRTKKTACLHNIEAVVLVLFILVHVHGPYRFFG